MDRILEADCRPRSIRIRSWYCFDNRPISYQNQEDSSGDGERMRGIWNAARRTESNRAEAAADASRDVTARVVGAASRRRSIFHSPGRRSFLLYVSPPIPSVPHPHPLPFFLDHDPFSRVRFSRGIFSIGSRLSSIANFILTLQFFCRGL